MTQRVKPPVKPMQQLNFDTYLSAQVRDVAIVQVDQHADVDWKAVALDTVRIIARCQITLTSDDVLAQLMHQTVTTHDRRALGPVMQRAHQRGWIVPTDRFVPSTNVLRHAQPTRVWRSKIFTRGGPA